MLPNTKTNCESVCERRVWRKWSNEELRSLPNNMTMVLKTEFGQLRWVGHVVRMDPSMTLHTYSYIVFMSKER